MPDPRFYEDLGPLTASKLAGLCGARLGEGADGEHPIRQAAPLSSADQGSVAFFGDRRYAARSAA